jgi:selenide,water dikinase
VGAHPWAGRGCGARPLTSIGEPRLRRLVLIGAGRANLRLLRALSRPIVRGLEIVLVTIDRDLFDPSMTSGLLRGAYALDDVRIDVAAVAERAGARVVHATADRIVPGAHVVHAGTERIAFDLCVLDEIGPSADADLPGVTEHAIALRPAARLAEVRRVVEERLIAHAGPVRCTIVGGGTTGIECAFSLQRMLRARPAGGVVTIVDSASDILRDVAPCRDIARRALEQAGVCFALGARVIEVFPEGVTLASGGSLPGDITIWATGGAPPSLIVSSELPHDARGRLLVDERLRARDGSPIWAAGDCAAATEIKADAESQDAVLASEIRRHLGTRGGRLARPRSSALCMLDTGDGRAILRWGGITMRSRLAWWLKRRADRRFVTRMRDA